MWVLNYVVGLLCVMGAARLLTEGAFRMATGRRVPDRALVVPAPPWTAGRVRRYAVAEMLTALALLAEGGVVLVGRGSLWYPLLALVAVASGATGLVIWLRLNRSSPAPTGPPGPEPGTGPPSPDRPV